MASAFSMVAGASSVNWSANFGGAHCLISSDLARPCSVSSVPVIFTPGIGTVWRCGRASRRRTSISTGGRDSGSLGKISARTQKESGEPRLKEALVSKEFSGGPLPTSGAAAEINDCHLGLSTDDTVYSDSLGVGDDLERQASKSLQVSRASSPPLETIGEKEVADGTTRSLQQVNITPDTEYVDLLVEESLKSQELLASKNLHRNELVKRARINTYSDKKIFFYPEPAVVTNELEIFFNRSITPLAKNPRIFIQGAFNGWRWKPFTEELKETNLPGDWWSCKIQIPKEAYKVDFIFSDRQNTYENNSKSDFFILVEGGMPKLDFEYFLLEEKAKEADRLAEEKAEKERILAEENRFAAQKASEEADRGKAKQFVIEKCESVRNALQKAVDKVDGLWYFQPPKFGGRDLVTLYYNRAGRSLGSSQEVWIHGGSNNWEAMVSIVKKLLPAKSDPLRNYDGDWWSVEVQVPEKAYMLNWVFADGPPNIARLYDNNDYQDFHAVVSNSVPEDVYWGEIEEEIYLKIHKETIAREDAARRKVEHRETLKRELKAKTMQTFLQSQTHIFYTEPSEVRAGGDVKIFYNPSNTVLNGKPEVYIRGSFNRWTYHLGPFQTTKLTPAENGTHLQATVKVPRDAYTVDFVFSERGDDGGGVYDNRNGLDYHVPVVGGIVRQPALNIVHIALEMAPIAKVGGLGDVVTSLSRAIEEQGHHAEVILPKYDCLNYQHIHDLHEVFSFDFDGTRVRASKGMVEGLTVHFLEPDNGFFWVGCVYGRRDDASRFGFFCHAALEYLLQSGQHVDIIHCHDWSSAPVAWLFHEGYRRDNLTDARIVFTIHNLEFGAAQIGRAMETCHLATTVSPTYAREISGNPLIAPHWFKFHGIRNGIDPEIWDPYFDPHIPVGYTSENVTEGKRAAKLELQRRLGLRQDDRPLVGIITRLTAQKGITLIRHGIWRTLDRGGQVVLLGSAPDPRVQNEFVGLSNQLNQSHGDVARLCLSYDEPLSHLIYAGADFILIPSIFEPCGLTQLTAMRYGAIPIVRQTGGLYDTVFDVDHDRDRAKYQGMEPNGFSFGGTDPGALDYALNRAMNSWYEARQWFTELCAQVMQQDWTWNRPALDYIELYQSAKKLQ